MPFLQAETDVKCVPRLLATRRLTAAVRILCSHCTRLPPVDASPRSRRNAFYEEKRLANEAELMKDVPGWEAGASVYKSGRYMKPMTVFGLNDDK